MRILVRHGHFAFFPVKAEDMARFSNYFGQDFVRDGDFYTFPLLKEAPRYSLAAKLYLNLPALTTYEGRGPWEVMRENDFVYNVATGLLVPKLAITGVLTLPLADTFFLCPTPLLQPGTRDVSGQQILSYDGEFNLNTFQLKILEISYV